LLAPTADNDDDDVDLIGEETREEKKVAEERVAKAASSKKKECNVFLQFFVFYYLSYRFVRNFLCKACGLCLFSYCRVYTLGDNTIHHLLL
jgi:MinD superfamily P-loop ATPase